MFATTHCSVVHGMPPNPTPLCSLESLKLEQATRRNIQPFETIREQYFSPDKVIGPDLLVLRSYSAPKRPVPLLTRCTFSAFIGLPTSYVY